jgi:transposase
VQIDLDTLPHDAAILQQMLREVVAATTQQHAELHAENDKLRLLIQRLLRHQFGRRSEQLDADQLQFGLEDLEQTVAENQAAQDAAAAGKDPQRPRREPRPNRNHGALPAHLPRYEVVIDIENRDCPCCGGALHAIDELRTEQLDILPAQLRVRVTRRPRYACRACEGAVLVAPAPERPIDGGMATEALIAHVVVSKFCDSLPLYRQVQMLARQGVTLDRSTLSNWVGRACWWLTPLYDLVVNTVLSSTKLFADDTTLPVLDPGRGRTKTGRLWTSYRWSSIQSLGLQAFCRSGLAAPSRLRSVAPCSRCQGRCAPAHERRCHFAASWTALARGALAAEGRDGGMSASAEQRDGGAYAVAGLL